MNTLTTTPTFHSWGPAHLTAIGLTLAISVGLPLLVRRFGTPGVTKWMAWIIAVQLVATELATSGRTMFAEGLAYAVDHCLPLHLCSAAIYLTAFTLVKQKQWIYELTYFWAICGTSQAIITPALEAGYPSFLFFKFFINHGFIILGVLYATLALGLRPTHKGIWRSFCITVGFAGFVAVMNALLTANYMFLCRPPVGESPLFFLPWPGYLPFLAVVAIVLFYIAWLPFYRIKPARLAEPVMRPVLE